jgi:uncharacterized Fe-S radical SAM superfamily protein PflX
MYAETMSLAMQALKKCHFTVCVVGCLMDRTERKSGHSKNAAIFIYQLSASHTSEHFLAELNAVEL